jgi:hypothetical protein
MVKGMQDNFLIDFGNTTKTDAKLPQPGAYRALPSDRGSQFVPQRTNLLPSVNDAS